jgi:hypothetical protein
MWSVVDRKVVMRSISLMCCRNSTAPKFQLPTTIRNTGYEVEQNALQITYLNIDRISRETSEYVLLG